LWKAPLRATERHLPYGITHCYLPPDTDECASPWFLAISAQFTFNVCVATRNRKKITKTHNCRNPRWFKVINVDTPKKSSLLFIMICSMFMPICNCFHARRADSNKMTTFWGGSEITMSQQCGCNTRARVTKAPARLKGLVVPRNSRKKLKHTYKQRKLTIFLSQARSSAALC